MDTGTILANVALPAPTEKSAPHGHFPSPSLLSYKLFPEMIVAPVTVER